MRSLLFLGFILSFALSAVGAISCTATQLRSVLWRMGCAIAWWMKYASHDGGARARRRGPSKWPCAVSNIYYFKCVWHGDWPYAR